jgi:hypothetical protein
MTKPEEALEQLQAENEAALLADGFEDCLVGICYQFGRPPLACYDYDKCVAKLMERDKMEHDEAVEFLEVNTIGSWVGDNTPVFTKLFT